jgi:hypothetical protein
MTMRVVHGTFAPLRTVLNGPDAGGPAASGPGRCFPGLPCNAAEVEQMERIERETNESTAYLVEMTGTTFWVPSNMLPHGAKESSGKRESVIVDAHTGFMKSQTISGPALSLAKLGPVSTFTATVTRTGSRVVIASIHRRRTAHKKR